MRSILLARKPPRSGLLNAHRVMRLGFRKRSLRELVLTLFLLQEKERRITRRIPNARR
jgi:hypothetical protein